jgi:hypothetical protein
MTKQGMLDLVERADEYLSTIPNKGNCGPHHLISDMRAALAAQADAPGGQPQSSKEAREKEITRLATIEECAMVAESYPSSGEQTEHPVEYWIRRLSHSRPDRKCK